MKAKNYLIVLILITIHLNSTAQNLVPNPSFENYVNCPNSFSSFNSPPGFPGLISPQTVTDWYTVDVGTPDYFNFCGSTPTSAPNSFFSYQMPRTGNAYIGIHPDNHSIVNGNPFHYREYVSCKLNTPLVAGKRYNIIFYINYAQGNSSDVNIAINSFGVNFSNNWFYLSSFYGNLGTAGYPASASYTGPFFTDTLNWTKVSMSYTAMGGEQIMTIGCFTDSANDVHQITIVTPVNPASYYYIDDVCVRSISDSADTTTYTQIYACSDTILTARPNMDAYLWGNGDTAHQKMLTDSGVYWVNSIKDCVVYSDTFHYHKKTINLHPFDTVICLQNDYFTLPADSTTLWYADSTSTVPLPAAPILNLSVPGTYTFYYTIVHRGCLSDKTRYTVTVNHLPTLDLGNDMNLCEGDSVILKATNSSLSYNWSTGSKDSTIWVTKNGIYTLRQTFECTTLTDSIKVSFENCKGCLMFPNAFTPNSDNRNDVFKPEHNCEKNFFYELYIFDRWGKTIFYTSDINKGWNGNFNGKKCDAGVYFYKAFYHSNRIQKTYKGDITLIR